MHRGAIRRPIVYADLVHHLGQIAYFLLLKGQGEGLQQCSRPSIPGVHTERYHA